MSRNKPKTVRELLHELSEYDPELEVHIGFMDWHPGEYMGQPARWQIEPVRIIRRKRDKEGSFLQISSMAEPRGRRR